MVKINPQGWWDEAGRVVEKKGIVRARCEWDSASLDRLSFGGLAFQKKVLENLPCTQILDPLVFVWVEALSGSSESKV
jgi:hypothetical protein